MLCWYSLTTRTIKLWVQLATIRKITYQSCYQANPQAQEARKKTSLSWASPFSPSEFQWHLPVPATKFEMIFKKKKNHAKWIWRRRAVIGHKILHLLTEWSASFLIAFIAPIKSFFPKKCRITCNNCSKYTFLTKIEAHHFIRKQLKKWKNELTCNFVKRDLRELKKTSWLSIRASVESLSCGESCSLPEMWGSPICHFHKHHYKHDHDQKEV